MTETWKLVVMQAEVARLGWDTGCGTRLDLASLRGYMDERVRHDLQG